MATSKPKARAKTTRAAKGSVTGPPPGGGHLIDVASAQVTEGGDRIGDGAIAHRVEATVQALRPGGQLRLRRGVHRVGVAPTTGSAAVGLVDEQGAVGMLEVRVAPHLEKRPLVDRLGLHPPDQLLGAELRDLGLVGEDHPAVEADLDAVDSLRCEHPPVVADRPVVGVLDVIVCVHALPFSRGPFPH